MFVVAAAMVALLLPRCFGLPYLLGLLGRSEVVVLPLPLFLTLLLLFSSASQHEIFLLPPIPVLTLELVVA